LQLLSTYLESVAVAVAVAVTVAFAVADMSSISCRGTMMAA